VACYWPVSLTTRTLYHLQRKRSSISKRYYHCVEDYFETFVQGYDEQFSRQYGFWRPYIAQVIYRYLDAACPVPDTGAICSTVLPVCNAKTAAMNTCWHFLVNEGIFVHPAIRSA
jgi:hypothetical protein